MNIGGVFGFRFLTHRHRHAVFHFNEKNQGQSPAVSYSDPCRSLSHVYGPGIAPCV